MAALPVPAALRRRYVILRRLEMELTEPDDDTRRFLIADDGALTYEHLGDGLRLLLRGPDAELSVFDHAGDADALWVFSDWAWDQDDEHADVTLLAPLLDPGSEVDELIDRHDGSDTQRQLAYEALEAAEARPYDLLDEAFALHGRGGHQRLAAARYREAIAEGASWGWFYLGALLADWPGREAEAEDAYRRALRHGDEDQQGWAAFRLACLLERRDDLEGAGELFERAERHEDQELSFIATLRLGRNLAMRGDKEGAMERLRSFTVWNGVRHDIDLAGAGLMSSRGWVEVLASRPGSRLWQSGVRGRHRLRTLVHRSERATSTVNRVSATGSRAVDRLWTWARDEAE